MRRVPSVLLAPAICLVFTTVVVCVVLALPTTINVRAGDNLQSAVDRANCGDIVRMEVATFSNITLSKVCGNNAIVIQSDKLSSIATGRVSPADGGNMPKIVVTRPNTPAITISPGASGYQMLGLEITNDLSGNTRNDITNGMIDISYTSSQITIERNYIHPKEKPTLETKWLTRGKFGISNNGSFVTVRGNYIDDFFGRDPVDAQITNGTAQQTHAVAVSSTADHTTIDNNYLEAWYTPLLVGGSDGIATGFGAVLAAPSPTLRTVRLSSVAGLSAGMILAVELPRSDDPAKCRNGITLPCWAVARVAGVNGNDVTFAQDLFNNNRNAERVAPYAMPLVGGQAVWAGTQPSDLTVTKNTFELPQEFSAYHQATNGNHPKGFIETKACLRCRVEGNIFTGFPGTLAMTTVNQNGGCPWCTTANVVIRNNWFQAYTQMVMLSLTDYISLSTQGHDITIENNLALNRDPADGSCVNVSGAAGSITISHNTCVGGYPSFYTGSSLLAAGPSNGGPSGAQAPYYLINQATGVVVRDNIVDAGNYTAICNTATGGTAYLNCFANPVQSNNVFVVNVDTGDPLSKFPGPTNKAVASWAAMKFTGGEGLFAWSLQQGSPARGAASDGTDAGADLVALARALSQVPVSLPSPSPTPALSPSPSPSPTPAAWSDTEPVGAQVIECGASDQQCVETFKVMSKQRLMCCPSGGKLYCRPF